MLVANRPMTPRPDLPLFSHPGSVGAQKKSLKTHDTVNQTIRQLVQPHNSQTIIASKRIELVYDFIPARLNRS